MQAAPPVAPQAAPPAAPPVAPQAAHAPFAPPKALTPWIVAGIVVTLGSFVIPFAYWGVSQWNNQRLDASISNRAERDFIAQADLPPCARPGRCAGKLEAHGTTYPICTDASGAPSPPRLGDFVVLLGPPMELAVIHEGPSGDGRYIVERVYGQRDTLDVSAERIGGALCHAESP
jgi:hypothetical protein